MEILLWFQSISHVFLDWLFRIFTFMGEENRDKIEILISEFEGSKAYTLDGASEDEVVRTTFEKIKEENGKVYTNLMIMVHHGFAEVLTKFTV